MSTEEIIIYLTAYIKACKIKGDPYIVVIAITSQLFIVDEDMSTLYIIDLDPHLPITSVATRMSIMNQGKLTVDFSIYNLIFKLVEMYRTMSNNDFCQITRAEVDYEIPSHASDNSKLTRYFLDSDPTKVVLVPEFYGMVPVTKSDLYAVYYKNLDAHSSILMYKIFKKKPKIEITMFRKILNLQ